MGSGLPREDNEIECARVSAPSSYGEDYRRRDGECFRTPRWDYRVCLCCQGHPILALAAVDNAKQSTFECVGCGNSGGEQSFIYSFEQSTEKPDPCCCSSHPSAHNSSQVTQNGNHITITAPPLCMCPDLCTRKWAEEHSHIRSAKCLYHWKCGHRNIGVE